MAESNYSKELLEELLGAFDKATYLSKSLQSMLTSLESKINNIISDGQTILHYTAANGDTKTNELLIDYGADLKVTDSDGQTPLHYAVSARNTEAIQVFLKAGADVNAVDKEGQTALQYAMNNGNHEIVQLLLNFVISIVHGGMTAFDLVDGIDSEVFPDNNDIYPGESSGENP